MSLFKKKEKKENENSFFYTKVFPTIAKMSTQKHLVTIRDAFGLLTPLIIAGAVSLALGIFIFASGGSKAQTSLIGLIAKAAGGVDVKSSSTGDTWVLLGGWAKAAKIGFNIFGPITDATIGLMSVSLSFAIAYLYTRIHYEKTDAVMSGFVGLTTFAIISHGFSGSHNEFMGSGGILISMIVAFLSSFVFNWLSGIKKLSIKLPKEVPPMVAKGFSYLIPIFGTLTIIGIFDSLFLGIGILANYDIKSQEYNNKLGKVQDVIKFGSGTYGFAGLFWGIISSPFLALAKSSAGGLAIGITMNIFLCFFWFFGINGSSAVAGLFGPFLYAALFKNAELMSKATSYEAVKDQMSTINQSFFQAYTDGTGWGQTGALIIATLIFGKIKSKREIAKMASVASVFNINEPVTFGYPLVLNVVFAIPLMLIMPLHTVLAWVVVEKFEWVHKNYLLMPWTIPLGIGALITSGFDWRALILSWSLFGLSILIYVPFVIADNKIAIKNGTLNLEDYEKEKEIAKELRKKKKNSKKANK